MRPHGDRPPPARGNTKKAAGGSRLAGRDDLAARGALERGRRRRGAHRPVPARPLGAGRGRQRPPPAAITADNSPRARSYQGRAQRGGGGRSPALHSSRCNAASLGRTARTGPLPPFASSSPRRGRPALLLLLLLHTASPRSLRDPPKCRGPPGPFASLCHGGARRGPAPPGIARPPRAHLPKPRGHATPPAASRRGPTLPAAAAGPRAHSRERGAAPNANAHLRHRRRPAIGPAAHPPRGSATASLGESAARQRGGRPPLRPPSAPRRGRPGSFREAAAGRPAPPRRARLVLLPAGRKAAPVAAVATETAGNGEGDRRHPSRARRKWRLRKPRLAPAARRRGGGALARPKTASGPRL